MAFGPVAALAEEHPTSAGGSLHLTSASGLTPRPSAIQVDFQVEEIEADQSAEVLDAKLAGVLSPNNSELVIVSSDEDAVLSQVVAASTQQPRGRLFLIPFGKAIKSTSHAVGGLNEALRFSGSYFVNAFKRDKIGVSIATFTLGNEIIRWMHVSTASNFV
ncbi:MAG: hypothetical protein EOP05_21695, partial [Proteobacteria bacterium]